mgnify:CR=1 FL=1|jgi:Fructose-2,6-bisphosphatase
MTTFYLIRHAEKDAPEDVLAGRTPGIGLSERGRRQAEAIAQRLAAEPIRAVCASPVQRAKETAEPLARTRGVQVQTRAGLHEIEFGEWTGKRFAELEAVESWRWFNRFRSGTRVPGGETIGEVQARFVAEMLRLREAYPNDGVALVSHGDPIRVALGYFLGAPLDLFERIEVGLASISVVAMDEVGATVLRTNDTHGTANA